MCNTCLVWLLLLVRLFVNDQVNEWMDGWMDGCTHKQKNESQASAQDLQIVDLSSQHGYLNIYHRVHSGNHCAKIKGRRNWAGKAE